MDVDVRAELDSAAARVRQPHLNRLRALGVSIDTIAEMGATFPIGIGEAEDAGNGLYQPGEGALHMILPIVEDGELVDLCAFRSNIPDRWLLRKGLGFALGLEDGLSPWLWYQPADPEAKPPRFQVGKPLHIFSNPLEWLRAGRDGVCVLDWSAPEIRRLNGFERLTVSDATTARLLRASLSRPVRIPVIDVLEAWANVA